MKKESPPVSVSLCRVHNLSDGGRLPHSHRDLYSQRSESPPAIQAVRKAHQGHTLRVIPYACEMRTKQVA